MNSNIWLLTFADSISIATTLILAALGALITERSGVINLGVEGMLLMGAVTAFLVGDASGNLWLALLVATLVGVVLSTVHAALTVGLRAKSCLAWQWSFLQQGFLNSSASLSRAIHVRW